MLKRFLSKLFKKTTPPEQTSEKLPVEDGGEDFLEDEALPEDERAGYLINSIAKMSVDQHEERVTYNNMITAMLISAGPMELTPETQELARKATWGLTRDEASGNILLAIQRVD